MEHSTEVISQIVMGDFESTAFKTEDNWENGNKWLSG